MKQAIAVVAFGTTVPEARHRQINAVFNFIKQQYADVPVHLAFTSRIIVKRLRDRGEMILTEEGLMEQLANEGVEQVIVQPLHFTGGEEFEKLKQNMLSYVGKGSIQEVKVGRPLLYFMGQEERPDDYQALIDGFIKPLNIPSAEGLVLIGHGGMNVGNGCYSVLQLKLLRQKLSNVRIAALECFPELSDIAIPWDWADGTTPKKVHLHPLLLVAGDHALNDIFADEDSILMELQDAGFEVVRHEKGLGEYEAIQKLYAEHLDDAINGRYEGRSKHRPKIPTIK